MTPPSKTAESLLTHSGWVRALAGALVKDPHLADDLVQETWLAALQRGPQRDGEERGWLATVLRNVLRQRRRGEGRRAEHEARVEGSEVCESTLDVVARAQSQRGIVEAVLALDEPYRTTVLLRYFEGLPPRVIATRRGLPLATVKSQLARGIERLRQQLDREYGGDGRAWVLALAPLAPIHGGLGAASSAGVLIVNTKSKLIIAGLVLAGALTGTIALNQSQPAGLPAQESGVVEAAVTTEGTEPVAEQTVTHGERVALIDSIPAEPEVAAAAPLAAESPSVARLRGRAFDDEGQPLAGVELRLSGSTRLQPAVVQAGDARFTSGSGGWFELELERETGFVVAGEGRATVLAARVRRAGSGATPIVVVAPAAPLAGRVVDEAGLAVVGAALTWELPDEFRSRFSSVLDDSVGPPRTQTTDTAGGFAFPGTPAVRGATLSVRAVGFEPLDQAAPQAADANMLLVMTRPVVDARSVVGRVVDGAGDPVEGAHVALGLDSTVSDAQGLFSFDLGGEPTMTHEMGFESDRLLAVKPGFLPVERSAGRDAEGRPEWPSEVVLRLEGEPYSISGRVERGDGSPAAGLPVWIADPSVFGAVGRRPALAESMLLGQPGERWSRVETDSEGRFELEGLLDRAYRVEAMDPRTLLRVGADGVQAGSEHLTLVLDDQELYATVSGRVVSRRGAPVAGASIFPVCDALSASYRGRRLFTNHQRVDGTRTDEDGAFVLHEVPRDLVYLRIDGDELIPLEYGRGVEGGLRELTGGEIEDLEIEVPLRCHLRVEASPECLADSICVLDGGGERVTLNVYEGTSRSEGDLVPLTQGRSATLALSDAGESLVLMRGEEELERLPLELTPGDVSVVRP